MVFKTIQNAASEIVKTNIWKKFTKPTVGRGKTAWPKTPTDLEKYGVRFDYDGEVTQHGVTYHKFQCQPNAGKIPSSVKKWRDANGGTHAVMGTVLVKKDGAKDDVRESMDDLVDRIE